MVQAATQKKPEVKKSRVPERPKQSSMFLKEEIAYINKISQPLFEMPKAMTSSHELWEALQVSQTETFKGLLRKLHILMNRRQDFTRKFASITTKRLSQLRRLGAKYTHKRKRDVVSEDILSLCATRADPSVKFAEELERFDPKYGGLLRAYRMEEDSGELSRMKSLCNLALQVEGSLREIYKHASSLYNPVSQ